MVTNTPIAGITIHQNPEAIHVSSQRVLTTLSSSFFGGGFHRVHHLINANVALDYCSDAPASVMRAIAARCGVTEPFVGTLTAVPMDKARAVFAQEGSLRVGALVTAGVGNATSAGVSLPFSTAPGTINIIVLLEAKLTRGAMVNAMITVTEAKTGLLQELDIRTSDGALATGTSTDAVTIAETGTGRSLPYAGPATVVGWLVAKCVRQALRDSLSAT